MSDEAPADGATIGRPPQFVVAGAGRAGTTAVIEALRAHPSIFVTRPKEPHFLAFGDRFTPFSGPGDDVTINRVAVTDERHYLDLYSGAGGRLAGEGSVSTLYYHQHSIPRLQALNPDVRVIIILRDPVERAQSAFQYLTVRGWETASSLVDAARMEDERVDAGWHHLWHYRRMSEYDAGVSAFREAFGSDQVGIWFYEDMAADGPRVIREIVSFLGLPVDTWEEAGLRRVNVSGSPKSLLWQRVIRGAGRRPFVRETIKNVVPFHMRERIRRANLRPVPVPSVARQYFAATFETDRALLSRHLGRPLPWES